MSSRLSHPIVQIEGTPKICTVDYFGDFFESTRKSQKFELSILIELFCALFFVKDDRHFQVNLIFKQKKCATLLSDFPPKSVIKECVKLSYEYL